jgi:hypothetical protein
MNGLFENDDSPGQVLFRFIEQAGGPMRGVVQLKGKETPVLVEGGRSELEKCED